MWYTGHSARTLPTSRTTKCILTTLLHPRGHRFHTTCVCTHSAGDQTPNQALQTPSSASVRVEKHLSPCTCVRAQNAPASDVADIFTRPFPGARDHTLCFSRIPIHHESQNMKIPMLNWERRQGSLIQASICPRALSNAS